VLWMMYRICVCFYVVVWWGGVVLWGGGGGGGGGAFAPLEIRLAILFSKGNWM